LNALLASILRARLDHWRHSYFLCHI